MEPSIERFLDAQTDVYKSALLELRTGKKHGHWMWYIFPQLRGLGQTEISWRFGICNAAEARCFLNHPILGKRLVECTKAVLHFKHSRLGDIFAPPDDMKFGSCMTLFALQENAPPEFQCAIDAFLGGEMDARTIALLRSRPVSQLP